jgi:hypothetical protein
MFIMKGLFKIYPITEFKPISQWDFREYSKGIYEWPLAQISAIVYSRNRIGISPTGGLKLRIRFYHDKNLSLDESMNDPPRHVKTSGNILKHIRHLHKNDSDYDFTIETSDGEEINVHKLMLAGSAQKLICMCLTYRLNVQFKFGFLFFYCSLVYLQQ